MYVYLYSYLKVDKHSNIAYYNINDNFHIPECGPPEGQDANHGKRCPGDPPNCLNNNQGYGTFAEAWGKCGKVAECSFIMRYKDNNYYLRRSTDPNYEMTGVWGYTYGRCISISKYTRVR